MQRVPTKNTPMNVQNNGRVIAQETSPLLSMARRVREEQGVEQLRAFLSAMAPFAAPNEIKRLCDSFGLSYASVAKPTHPAQQKEQYVGNENGFSQQEPQRKAQQQMNQMPRQTQMPQQIQMPQQMQMLQTLMRMQGFMNGGKLDPSQLLGMMGGGR